MKKLQLKKLTIPWLLFSIALVAQANDHSHKSHGRHPKTFDFYGFNQMEYYAGAGLGSSTLKNAELNRNTDAEIIKSTNKLKDLIQVLDYSVLQGVFYKQKRLNSVLVLLISNSDIAHPILIPISTPSSPLDKAVALDKAADEDEAGLLVSDGVRYPRTTYTLPDDEYKKQFDAKYKPEFPSFNATGFYFDAENVTHFSAMLGAKALNKHQFFIGIEAQATYFKEKYESLVDTYKLQGKTYSSYPEAAKIYLTHVKNDNTNNNVQILSENSEAKVMFNAKKLKINKTFTGQDHIYATLKLKRKLAFTGDVSFGKRFELKNGVSLDAFAILGYGYTNFEVKNDNKRDKRDRKTKGQPLKVVTYSLNEEASKDLLSHVDNETKDWMRIVDGDILKFLKSYGALDIKEVTQLELENKSATGLRWGAGLTLNFQNQYAVSLKVVQAKLKGYSLLDDQLKSLDMSLSFQYKF